jgi:hypothetical protein
MEGDRTKCGARILRMGVFRKLAQSGTATAGEATREVGMVRWIFVIAMLTGTSAACATAEGPSPLTVAALERVKITCGAPDARLVSDEFHLSIVLDGDSPDRRRQTRCLFEEISARGYWVDQIVIQRANTGGL